MGGLDDVTIFWGVIGAMFAVAAGFGLAVAAIALRHIVRATDIDFTIGYNALAPTLDR